MQFYKDTVKFCIQKSERRDPIGSRLRLLTKSISQKEYGKMHKTIAVKSFCIT